MQALCKLAVRTEDLAAKAYLYHILHEVQMSAFTTSADVMSIALPQQPYVTNKDMEAKFGELCASLGLGKR